MSIMGPRGIMTAIPVDEERRLKALNVIDCFLSGQSYSRTQLFGIRPDKDKWHSRYLSRLVKDGGIQVSGLGTYRRIYKLADREALLRFKNLFSEIDSTVKEKGLGNRFTMTPELRALSDGLPLGDAHISKLISGGLSCALSISQREDRVGWLEAVKKTLTEHGVIASLTLRPGQVGLMRNGKFLNGRPSYLLRTICYRNLKEERLRWYPEGKKIVPWDIDVANPITLAHWYMGDGGVSVEKGTVTIATCSFTRSDVEWLRDQIIQKLGIIASVVSMRGYLSLSMCAKHGEAFLKLVRPHVVECFKYKVPLLWEPNICKTCNQAINNRTKYAKFCDDCCSKDELTERKQRDVMALSV